MALKEITEHILNDGQAKGVEIKKNAEQGAKVILDEAKASAEREREKILREAQKKAKEERKRIIAMARLEARNTILTAKQNQVEVVFKSVLQDLDSLSDSEYKELVKRLLRKAVKGGEEVIVNERDRNRINASLLAEIDGSIALSNEIRDIDGGFILKTGRIETNNSFNSLISAVREEIEPKIVEVLFGE